MLNKLFGKLRDKKTLKKITSSKKKIILIGGAKGTGKHAIAKRIQHSLQKSIIINKNDSSSVLRETLLEMYQKTASDNVSPEYIHKIEPLEYKQLFKTIEHLLDFNDCDIIAIAPFFEQFAESQWVNTLEIFCKDNNYDLEMIFLYRNSVTNFDKHRHLRTNLNLRKKINLNIGRIITNSRIKSYSTQELYS